MLRNTINQQLICGAFELPNRDKLDSLTTSTPRPEAIPSALGDDRMSLEGEPQSEGGSPKRPSNVSAMPWQVATVRGSKECQKMMQRRPQDASKRPRPVQARHEGTFGANTLFKLSSIALPAT